MWVQAAAAMSTYQALAGAALAAVPPTQPALPGGFTTLSSNGFGGGSTMPMLPCSWIADGAGRPV
jgi:PPE-repeat protein